MYLLGCFFRNFMNSLVEKLEMIRSKSILRLDIRMSRLDIRMSNLKVGVGHTYVQAIMNQIGLDIRMSNPYFQVGHTYVQPPNFRLDIRMSKLTT